jgi:hypothetical protein
MQAGVRFGAYFFPRDRLHFAAIDLPHAPFDFFGPCSLDAWIAIAFEAVEKHAGELGALDFGKIRCLAKKLFDVP